MKSDSQLKQDIEAELVWEPSATAAQLGVAVKDGIVTITGPVASYAERCSVEHAAHRVVGVKGVIAKLGVNLPALSTRSDADITHAAQNVLNWWTYLPTNTVKVKVHKGWITLSGEVEWEYQRRSAVDAILHLTGIMGIHDTISIEPKVALSAVKSEIEAALKRRATAEAQQISVEIHGADVTLTGTVHSWSDRQLATHSAWATPGVRNVVDNITIGP